LTGTVVTIAATPDTATSSWLIQETLPSGWTANNIDNSGIAGTDGKVRWGPFSDTIPRTFHYTATPPFGSFGPRTFSGLADFDLSEITVSGDSTMNSSIPGATINTIKAFPNPFRPSQGQTSMSFYPTPPDARIQIFTLLGKLVKDIPPDSLGGASWDGMNQSGEQVAS